MDFPIIITRKKIKNMYLRVHTDGTVTVSAPRRLSEKTIREFISSKSDWILAQREKMLQRQNIAENRVQENKFLTGEIHFLWGQPYTLLVEETTRRGSVTLVESTQTIVLCVPENSTVEQRELLMEEFYHRRLKEAIPPLLEKHVRVVGRSPSKWSIRNMKTRWGSCSVQNGSIRLALNLAKKPVRCLEYVIAHELTHLHEPNHSKAFWNRMDVYFPDWKAVRKLLNER